MLFFYHMVIAGKWALFADWPPPKLLPVCEFWGWLRVRRSSGFTLSNTGMWMKLVVEYILFAILWLNQATFFLIYWRKASDEHWPMIMMVYTGTLARCITIAAPEQREWVPISPALIPSFFSPMLRTATFSAFLMSTSVTWDILPASVSKVFIWVNSVVFLFSRVFSQVLLIAILGTSLCGLFGIVSLLPSFICSFDLWRLWRQSQSYVNEDESVV